MTLAFAAVTVVFQVLASAAEPNEVAGSPSCGASWLPEPAEAVHWALIDDGQGVVTAGNEIVAGLQFQAGRIQVRSRERASAGLLDTRVEQGEDPSRLSIEARVRLDSSCVLSIHGVATRTSNAHLVDQAAAWLLVGAASDAEQDGDLERAGALATRALDLVRSTSASEFPQRLEFAALAVEKLLQAGHRDRAIELLTVESDAAAAGVPDRHPSMLRFQMARARALSFSDRDREALNLRLASQPALLDVFGSSSDESLSNRLRIANLRLELGDYAQARVELESLRDELARCRDPGHALRISTIRALANALALLALEQDSVSLLAQLRQELVIAHGENDGQVVDVEEQIARTQARLEQFESALQGASRVFLWRMQHLGFSNIRTLQSAWTLAYLYKEVGRYDTARALIARLLEESNRVAASVPTELTLKTAAVLGAIEGAQGHIDSAQRILRSTWQQYAAIVGENSDDTARALMSYALLLLQGGRVDRICPDVQKAFGEERVVLQPDPELGAVSRILTGLCLLTDSAPAGSVREGLARLAQGRKALEQRAGAGSSSAMVALSTLAWANYRFGDRQIAKELLQDLTRRAEQSRLAAPERSYTRDYWFSTWMTDRSRNLGYRTLALLHAQDGELDEAIRISELARDRRLRDRFLERGWLSAQLAAPEREELRALTSEICGLDSELAFETNIVERVELEARRILAVAARDDLEKRVSRQRIEPSSLDVPTLAALRRRVDARTAVVSIQFSAERWWAVVMTRDAPARLVMLDSEPDLGIAVNAWMSLLRGITFRAWPAGGNRLIQSYERPASATGHYLSRQALAQRVARATLDPIVRAAPGARRFVIVADDELSGVPFGAMPIGGVAAIEKFEIAYAPSLVTYAALGNSGSFRAWPRDLLSIAVDDVVAPPAYPGAAPDPRSDAGAIRSMLDYASAHPLAHAAREAEAASRNFAPARITVARGTEATKAALVRASADGSLAGYRYVHIAAHAFSFAQDPERSMMILSAAAAGDPASRVLTAAELANLQMSSELLVLAACRTGVGRYEPGQGPLGFAFAALAAGNQAAVLSLWEVADDQTERFMTGFYQRLKRGMRPATALAETQREFAQDPDTRLNDPSIWAAFVLYGRS